MNKVTPLEALLRSYVTGEEVDPNLVGREQRKKPHGFYARMSDEEIIEYTKKYHEGSSKTDLHGNESGLYNRLREKELLPELIERGVIVEKQKPNGFYSRMSDEELVLYAREEYQGSTKIQIKQEERGLHKALHEKGLLKRLVDEGIIVERSKPNGFFSKSSHKELQTYVRKHHHGESLGGLAKKENGLYNELRERGMIETMVNEGNLVRKRRASNFYRSMSDQDLFKQVAENHTGLSRSELHEKNPNLYQTLNERKILDECVAMEILVQKKTSWGTFVPWENIIKALERLRDENNGTFPSYKNLKEHHKPLLKGIHRHHGGFRKVREMFHQERNGRDQNE